MPTPASARATVSKFNVFLMKQLKGGIHTLICSPKEKLEYLIALPALKVPNKYVQQERQVTALF